jgi:hypothetical protein
MLTGQGIKIANKVKMLKRELIGPICPKRSMGRMARIRIARPKSDRMPSSEPLKSVT